MPTPAHHPRDPLHGITLETILNTLLAQHGWEKMAHRIPIRCFQFDPSIKSSLTFLRKTPWARTKVEDWFLGDRWREQSLARNESSAPPEETFPSEPSS